MRTLRPGRGTVAASENVWSGLRQVFWIILCAITAALLPTPSAALTNPSAKSTTYAISGAVAHTSATITLSGAALRRTTTDSDGTYKFTGLTNGSYTVTVNKSGYAFSPTFLNVLVEGESASGVNFTGEPVTHEISGVVTGAEAPISLSGATSATTTSSDGTYKFDGLENGSYKVTAANLEHTFSPATGAVSVASADASGVTFSATPRTYSISGKVSGYAATVTLSGASTAATTVAANGNYTFSGLPNGDYMVAASEAGVTFTPASRTVTVSSARVTGINFTRKLNTYSISGTVIGSAASVTLSGASSATSAVAADGTYTFSHLAKGTYAVTATQPGFTFTPASTPVTVSSANVMGVNFSGTRMTYCISGSVSGSAATVTLSGAAAATTSVAASGTYTFSGLANGSYTVTATQSGYTFAPASAPVTVSSSNVTGVSFTGTLITYSISGTVSGSAATVTLSGASSATTSGAANGTYTFSGLANGLYVASASQQGFSFSPSTASVTVSSANVTGVNFGASVLPPIVSLSWAASVSPNIAGYNVYRSAASGGPYALITASLITGTSYVDSTVTAAQTYYYVTTAVDSNNDQSAYSNQAVAIVPTAATLTPPPGVSLSWTASASPNITGYEVYRSTVSGGPYTLMNTSLVAGTNYVDNNTVAGQTFYYVTTAVDRNNNQSAYSNQAGAVVP